MSVKNVLDKVDLSKISSGFYYTTQLIYEALNLGIKITEIPIKFKLREPLTEEWSEKVSYLFLKCSLQ